ncbi:MAG TPA: alanine racemase [Malonomonas sp.]
MIGEYPPRPTWAEIDLDALEHNLRQAQRCCLPQQRILAVVKADAYGHGALPVTRRLVAAGVEDFAVATLDEALELRRGGITARLMVLGGCYPGQEAAFIKYRLLAVLLDAEAAQRLSAEALRQQQVLPVHLKVDTGMGRVGFLPDQLREFLPNLQQLAGLKVVGLMSHLACADELDSSATTGAQHEQFRAVQQLLASAGIVLADIHISNSAGLVGWPSEQCNLVRPGIMLYGGLPGPDFADRLELRQVMNLRSCIAQLRTVAAGSGISYGHHFHTTRQTKVAVLPIGYADGYNRLFSSCGQVILHGRKVPVLGRVCMDWIMLDVTDLPQVAVGDCATLLGQADGLSILGDDWAQQLGTISYEVFCRIGSRVPRRYLPEPS